MTQPRETQVPGAAAACLTEQLSRALTELVSVAELFGCKPSFWRWAGDAAALLGRDADALKLRARFGGDV